MKCRLLLLFVPALVLALCACRSGRPIGAFAYDVPQNTSQKAMTQKMMHDAIVRGCLERGWRVAEPSANLIEATVVVRGKHTVVVDIPYTTAHYDIKYKSSVNMDYKTKDGTPCIHPNYNKWVGLLDEAIRKNILISSL
ncbi:hypothetical protein [uncultured Desulfovibrio sp.]|uniref:hypothetical protein n=1 Tax=uncultured Desulfovibrio sp. TaxID=167968 RepID=UPI00261EA762|nr:hypothetical protein [uncultured Desulfovibrio sp.]